MSLPLDNPNDSKWCFAFLAEKYFFHLTPKGSHSPFQTIERENVDFRQWYIISKMSADKEKQFPSMLELEFVKPYDFPLL